MDTQAALVAQLIATIQGDDAAIATAQLNLDFTNITSPIEGRTAGAATSRTRTRSNRRSTRLSSAAIRIWISSKKSGRICSWSRPALIK